MVNSNCQALNICTEAEPDTDKARAEAVAELGRGEEGGRTGRQRDASEAASRTEAGEARPDTCTQARAPPHPAAGGNLEVRCIIYYYWS